MHSVTPKSFRPENNYDAINPDPIEIRANQCADWQPWPCLAKTADWTGALFLRQRKGEHLLKFEIM